MKTVKDANHNKNRQFNVMLVDEMRQKQNLYSIKWNLKDVFKHRYCKYINLNRKSRSQIGIIVVNWRCNIWNFEWKAEPQDVIIIKCIQFQYYTCYWYTLSVLIDMSFLWIYLCKLQKKKNWNANGKLGIPTEIIHFEIFIYRNRKLQAKSFSIHMLTVEQVQAKMKNK